MHRSLRGGFVLRKHAIHNQAAPAALLALPCRWRHLCVLCASAGRLSGTHRRPLIVEATAGWLVLLLRHCRSAGCCHATAGQLAIVLNATAGQLGPRLHPLVLGLSALAGGTTPSWRTAAQEHNLAVASALTVLWRFGWLPPLSLPAKQLCCCHSCAAAAGGRPLVHWAGALLSSHSAHCCRRPATGTVQCASHARVHCYWGWVVLQRRCAVVVLLHLYLLTYLCCPKLLQVFHWTALRRHGWLLLCRQLGCNFLII